MRLSKRWIIGKLLALPESGMGYHTVDIYLKSGTVVKKVLIINCETVVDQGNLTFSENDIQDIKLHQ